LQVGSNRFGQGSAVGVKFKIAVQGKKRVRDARGQIAYENVHTADEIRRWLANKQHSSLRSCLAKESDARFAFAALLDSAEQDGPAAFEELRRVPQRYGEVCPIEL
jgi:hypothetical protein